MMVRGVAMPARCVRKQEPKLIMKPTRKRKKPPAKLGMKPTGKKIMPAEELGRKHQQEDLQNTRAAPSSEGSLFFLRKRSLMVFGNCLVIIAQQR